MANVLEIIKNEITQDYYKNTFRCVVYAEYTSSGSKTS